jgi:hypothetical protein
MAAADVPRSLIKKSAWGEENPTAAEMTAFMTDLAAMGSTQSIGKKALGALAPAAKQVGSLIRRGLQSADALIDNPVTQKAQQLWEKTIWDNMVSPVKNYLTNPEASLLERTPLPNKLKEYLGRTATPVQKLGRFLTEKVQPGIDRAPGGAASTIREGRAQEALLAREGEALGSAALDLPLIERLDLLRGIRGEPAWKLAPGARTLLGDYRRRVQRLDLDPELVKDFSQKQAELYTKMLKSPENVLVDPTFRTLLEGIEHSVPDDTFFRNSAIRKSLKKVISNPTTTDDTIVALKELYQLPATTPEKALEAARFASNAYLERSLQSLPVGQEVVSPFQRPGFVKSDWHGLKGLWVERNTNLELEALAKIEQYSHGIFNRYFTTPWKTMKIILSPAAQIRNTFTNFLLNDIDGLPVWRLDVYHEALKRMGKMQDTSVQGWKRFARETGGGGTFARNELTQLESKWKYATHWYDLPGKFVEAGAKYPKAIYNANEQLFKYAKYLHNLEKGMAPREAAHQAMKATFNYAEITPMVGFARSHFMPFATWTSKVIPFTFEQAVKHPLRVGKWFGMFALLQNHAIQRAGMDQEEWEDYKKRLPEYMQSGLYLLMPWRDSKDRLNMVDLTYVVPGIGDMREMTSRGIWEAVFQHPATTLPADLLRNKKFSGEPIRYDWQPFSVRRWNDMAHIWESAMPSWFGPWGTDYKRYMRAMQEAPGAQTVEQALAAQFGFKIKPLEASQVTRAEISSRRRQEGEMAIEMNKELRKTQDPEERALIIQKYAAYRRQLLDERFRGSSGSQD